MKMTVRPSCDDLAQRLEQRVRLVGREHRGRLVEDQHLRLFVERLQDLDALALADRELPDARPRVDRQAVALAELPHLVDDRARIDSEAPPDATPVAEDQVLRDGEALDEPEVLMNHADARVDRVARRAEADRRAVQADLAFVGAIEPAHDVRQRRLARAVLAEQRVHLAGRPRRSRRRRSPRRPGSAS